MRDRKGAGKMIMKVEMEQWYNKIGSSNIDKLYAYSCLLASGFDKEQAFSLYELLIDLWLKDENNYGLSKLSDMLYDIYSDIEDNINGMSIREVLDKIYEVF